MSGVLFTIGHSTRSLDALIQVIRSRDIAAVVDVRRYPASRRHPHFAKAAMSEALARLNIGYRHEEVLGGRRSRRPMSPNGAWQHAGFQGYADHANTTEFQTGLDRVLCGAEREATAVMCAEAVPWRCHRRIISDHAVLRGWRVVHVIDTGDTLEHELHPRARRTADGAVVYPPQGATQRDLWS